VTRAALWGHDHVELGRTASKAAGPRAAVAISRGGAAKLYSYVDPNEDVACAVAGDHATLLAVADGHNGMTASRIAIEVVLRHIGEEPPPGLTDSDWVTLFGIVNEAILAAKLGTDTPHSACALSCALVTRDFLSWASAGDTAVVVARPGASRGRQLNREAMRFVGHPMKPRALERVVGRGTRTLEEGEWVALITDGYSEFAGRPAESLPSVLVSAADDAETGARAIVDHACARGAGDNVAAAVWR
jgi:serine/threonine protein phosphatase PrpC